MMSPSLPAQARANAADSRAAGAYRLARAYDAHARKMQAAIRAQWFSDGYAPEKAGVLPLTPDLDQIADFARARAEAVGRIIALAVVDGGDAITAYSRAANLAQLHQIEPPRPDPDGGKPSITTCILQLRDEYWWRRQAEKVVVRRAEIAQYRAGKVHQLLEPCASNQAVSWRRDRDRRTAAAMADMYVECGDVAIPLAECVAASVSNPTNRRHEVMARLHGLENWAHARGWGAIMVNRTLPSRFHRVLRNGRQNPKWDGISYARECQAELCAQWARDRAQLANHGIKSGRDYAGFRAAEPHHDGTTHWHMLVFASQDTIRRIKAVIRISALKESPDEPGAALRRVTFNDIDPKRGSAVGYVSKYVAKNIDGAHVGDHVDPLTGEVLGTAYEFEYETGDRIELGTAVENVERVLTWARQFRIRQFQFYGAGKITVYRELRRVREPVQGELLEPLRKAADEGDFASFLELCGAGAPQLMRPTPVADGEYSPLSKYLAPAVPRLRGLSLGVEMLITREHEWSITHRPDLRRKRDAESAAEGAVKPPRTRGINCIPDLSFGDVLRPMWPIFTASRTPTPLPAASIKS